MKLANESKTTDIQMIRNRRQFLLQATAIGASPLLANAQLDDKKKAQIVITYDHYTLNKIMLSKATESMQLEHRKFSKENPLCTNRQSKNLYFV